MMAHHAHRLPGCCGATGSKECVRRDSISVAFAALRDPPRLLSGREGGDVNILVRCLAHRKCEPTLVRRKAPEPLICRQDSIRSDHHGAAPLSPCSTGHTAGRVEGVVVDLSARSACVHHTNAVPREGSLSPASRWWRFRTFPSICWRVCWPATPLTGCRGEWRTRRCPNNNAYY